MPQTLAQLKDYLDRQFAFCQAHDYSNNGLQVETDPDTPVSTIAFAVDACRQTFEMAVAEHAQLLIVHHGLSWRNGFRTITGLAGRRISYLLKNNLALYGVHLPLDAHPEFGNNAVLADMLKLKNREPFFIYEGVPIGFYGDLPRPFSLEELSDIIGRGLSTQVRLFDFRKAPVRRIGIVSGGGADAIEECAGLGLDALFTGEMIHQHYHEARELNIDVIHAGHYATETTGVGALMARIQKEMPGIRCVFLKVPTGL